MLLRRMQITVHRNKVPVIFQDRLYLFLPGQPLCIGQAAAVVDALRRILPRQAQQPQTQAVGLLRMRFFCQTLADPCECVGPHTGRPVFQPPRGPLLVMAVALRHMLCRGTVTRMKTSRMAGDHLPLRPDLKQVVEGMEFHRFTDVLMRYRVMMLLIFDVIIDIDLRFFDVAVSPWLYR